MTLRGRPFLFSIICSLVFTLPSFAQTPDERISQLEQKLDALLAQAEEIRLELQQLKPAAADDLTAVTLAPTTEPQPQQATAEPSLADVRTVENQVSPGAAKALNPDISVIGTFLGHAGDNELEERSPFALDEVELALETFIDPYAKGRFFIAVTPEEVDVEEGYAQFVTLPWGLTAKAGKTKATFGKVNTFHTHTNPWVDQPLMFTRFLGDEGLADVGLSVSKTIPNSWNTFVEATGEVYSGEVEGAFGRASDNDLFYNAHLKAFRDLSENANVEVGTSWARGTLPAEEGGSAGGHNQLTGVDVTMRWKPLASASQSFIGRIEAIVNRRSDFDRNLYGFYASGDYQLARRWFAGVRVDRADAFVDSERFTDRGASGTITFRPSEFSQLRGQLRRTKLGIGPSFNEFLVQLQFAIGAHGAHSF